MKTINEYLLSKSKNYAKKYLVFAYYDMEDKLNALYKDKKVTSKGFGTFFILSYDELTKILSNNDRRNISVYELPEYDDIDELIKLLDKFPGSFNKIDNSNFV